MIWINDHWPLYKLRGERDPGVAREEAGRWR
jgi:hypothetical protein